MPCLLILENAPSAEARHASLREGLRRMLGVPVEVVYDTLGKPSLVGGTPLRYLSVTTTGSYMVAALAETPLGIDGERRDRFTPDRTARLLAAANRFFTAADASFVRADPRRFGEVWVRRRGVCRNTPDAAYAPSPSSRSATGTPCLRRSTACGLNRWPCRCPTRTRIFSPSRADGSPERGSGVISQQRLSSAVVSYCRLSSVAAAGKSESADGLWETHRPSFFCSHRICAFESYARLRRICGENDCPMPPTGKAAKPPAYDLRYKNGASPLLPFRRIIGGFLIYISALYIRSYSREFPFARPFFYGPFLRLLHGIKRRHCG